MALFIPKLNYKTDTIKSFRVPAFGFSVRFPFIEKDLSFSFVLLGTPKVVGIFPADIENHFYGMNEIWGRNGYFGH